MGPAQKKTKKSVKKKVRKKKHSAKKKLSWFTCGIITPDMRTINRALYIHKFQCADGKTSWKVAPKDSCEVYRQRQRRNNERRKNKGDESSEDRRSQQCRCRARQRKYAYVLLHCRLDKKAHRRHSSCSSYTSRSTS